MNFFYLVQLENQSKIALVPSVIKVKVQMLETPEKSPYRTKKKLSKTDLEERYGVENLTIQFSLIFILNILGTREKIEIIRQ